ncbi:hypothetical protein Syun_017893 [Stephania yunnanensis]|uniref:Uncharacterized protein n=1 Tax=Stephania yunnanensis TaxID=152371 RepID=A0AAP0J7W1_9MAGN
MKVLFLNTGNSVKLQEEKNNPNESGMAKATSIRLIKSILLLEKPHEHFWIQHAFKS